MRKQAKKDKNTGEYKRRRKHKHNSATIYAMIREQQVIERTQDDDYGHGIGFFWTRNRKVGKKRKIMICVGSVKNGPQNKAIQEVPEKS